MSEDEATVEERVAALEATVATLQERLARVTDRDLPLLKGTVRATLDPEVEAIIEFPDAGRAFNTRLGCYEERLDTVERRLAMLGNVTSTPDTKAEKFAAVLAFASNKRNGRSKVAITPHEIRGCAGVSRRYAYELIDSMGETLDGVAVRESTTVETGSGTKRKGKALLVDCDALHSDPGAVKEFTTGGGDSDRS